MIKVIAFIKANAKPIIQIIVALALAIIVYKSGKRFLGWLNSGNGYEDQLGVDNGNLTISPATATGMADRIEASLALFGRDVDAVNEVLDKMVTADDLKLLIVKFGRRSAFSIWFDGEERNLVQWLQKRLFKGEMERVAAKFNQLGVPI